MYFSPKLGLTGSAIGNYFHFQLKHGQADLIVGNRLQK